MTNTTTTETAAVADQGANIAPEKATSKKGASKKKGAPKAKPAAATAAKVADPVSGTNAAPAQVKADAAKPARVPKAKKPAAGSKPKTKRAAKQPKAKSEIATPREGTAKAKVLAMMQRKGGATLDSIVKETGWQKHTVRGFISILGSKHNMKISSTKRDSDGARVYSVV
jgi:hypothetical protein